MKNSFYVTTPIYYANGTPHIGHAFTTYLADTLARYHRHFGKQVRFTTGTDEHGQKVQEVAQQNNRTPLEQADLISQRFRDAWVELAIEPDDFIRTTEERHKKVVNNLVKKLMDQGDIYKGVYKGWYLIEEEDFYPESRVHEVSDDPENDPRLQRVEEENYFFRLSSYTEKLKAHYEQEPDFVLPRNRRNEMLSFLEQGLDDISISRAKVSWGIPVPGDEGQVIYVWIEALMNYLTSAGIYQSEEQFNQYWPAQVQIVGKDILKFHAIYWPALLLALDLPLPKTILAHGWILSGGEKMSKSKGNTQDPLTLCERFGSDALRYTLIREVSLGQDGNFDQDILANRYNVELANDLGNLFSRTLGFARKRGESELKYIPQSVKDLPVDELDQKLGECLREYKEQMDSFQLSRAQEALVRALQTLNQFVDASKPWQLAKENQECFLSFTHLMANSLYTMAQAFHPFLPQSCDKIFQALGTQPEESGYSIELSQLKGPIPLGETPTLFPKIKLETNQSSEKQPAKKKNKQKSITIEDFEKVKMELVTILEANSHPDAEKLLVLQVSTSQGKRQVVSGISKYYEPGDLPGKQVVLVKNLEEVEIRGVKSQGMILAASNKKELSLVTVDSKIQEGSKVS